MENCALDKVRNNDCTCAPLLQAVSQEGLGDRFQPSVKASCVGGTMTIRVDTQEPFEGIIHGPNRTEAGCSVVGRGGTKTYLRIDLTKTDGGEGGCGVKYNEVSVSKTCLAIRLQGDSGGHGPGLS